MSVCDGRPPRPNPEPWPEGRVPTNNLERLIASAPRPPEKPPAAPKAPDSHVIPPPRGTGSQQEVTRLDILSLIHSQCHRVYASAIDREDIDTKYMAEIEEALRAVYADAELASRGRAQGGNTSENSRDQSSGKTSETRMGTGFEGGPIGSAPAAGTEKDVELSPELQEIHRFLLGEGKLEGVNFGGWHSLTIGEWWWRKRLRAAIAAHTKAGKDLA